jgi:hypothetical protein
MHLLCENGYKILSIVQFYKSKKINFSHNYVFRSRLFAIEKVAKKDITKNEIVISGLHIFITGLFYTVTETVIIVEMLKYRKHL